jgi:nucleotide-binding universal stress UspA family protein
MVGETTTPLLLIPPSATYTDLTNVVLGIDVTSPLDAMALNTALRLARQFKSVVNVLCIHKQPTDTQVMAKAGNIRSLIGRVPHTLTILAADEVYNTLLIFAHSNKANLIMMLPQKHNWFSELFAEGNTKRVARLTDIPLMAVV